MKLSEAKKIMEVAIKNPTELMAAVLDMIDEIDKPEKKVEPRKVEKKAPKQITLGKPVKKAEKKPRICEICGKPITGRGNKKMCDICRTAKDILS